jgi:hypothetical protein
VCSYRFYRFTILQVDPILLITFPDFHITFDVSNGLNSKQKIRSIMKTIIAFSILCLILISCSGMPRANEVPFTLEDRDRIIRTEQNLVSTRNELGAKMDGMKSEMNGIKSEMNAKMDGLRSEMNARFEQLFNFLYAIIGIFTAMTISVFGFAFWDRKLSLAPVRKENEKTITVLRELSNHIPALREILKSSGML